MTREEAKKWLNKLYARADITDEYGDMEDTQPYEEAVDMAIKALEQQPCTDAISRDDALKAIAKAKTVMSENNELFVAMINAQMNIHLLPSVSTEKTGRWILTQRGKFIDINCSECGNTRIKDFAYGYTIDELNLDETNDFIAKTRMNYCECCGAKMEGGDTE